jgi:phenylalanyl-tRNA synthetase beta chain
MKFSFEWLKSFLKFDLNPKEIQEILTLNLAETFLFKRGNRLILDIELLPDRIGDCSSHLGLAKEIALLKGNKFSWPKVKVKETKVKIEDYLNVKIKTNNCDRYVSRVIFNVKVKESPKWLKERLKDCGLRPINNIVDASNYVMLLTGQPLHVFDFDKIEGKNKRKEIIIRQAENNEKITTLEGKDYLLNEEVMVISSLKDALAIAGIKGGKKAEVDKNTKNIILESAHFKGSAIRKASRLISLKTDASYRFEHNLPLELSDYAIDVLANLIQELAGGEILKGKIDVLKKDAKKEKTLIILEWQKINRFLGVNLNKKEVLKILENLDFQILKKTENYLLVSPNTFREFNYPEEIIGEIARIKGFNNFPSCPPEEILKLPEENENWILKNDLRSWLKGFNLEEVYNYSFISKEEGIFFKDETKSLISLKNPISENFYYLRPTLLFNFLKNVRDNFRFFDKVRLFEIGKIYYFEKKLIVEKEMFSGILAEKEKNKSKDLFYEGKGIIETLFEKFGLLKEGFQIKEIEEERYKSFFKKGLEILDNENNFLGVIGLIENEIKQFYDLKESEIAFWEIDLENLRKIIIKEIEFQPLPLYPAVIRDISFFIKKNVLIDNILFTIQNSGVKYLEDVDLFDIYEKEGEEKSLSFHLIFRSKEKTLTSEDVDQEMEKIYKSLKQIGAKIR